MRPIGACPECDLIYHRRPISQGETAHCARCGAKLYSRSRVSPDQFLGLVISALVVYVIANCYPIVDLQVQGQHNSATLFGSILALWHQGRNIMAALVFATTQLFPLLDLFATLTVLLIVCRHKTERPRWFGPLLRFIIRLRPWGMVEVFMLGVLVALVKLSHLAHVLPGIALWAFAALTFLLAMILTLDLRSLWDHPSS